MTTLFLVGATAGISTQNGPVGGGVRILEHLLESFPSLTSAPLIKIYANSIDLREEYLWGQSVGLRVPILAKASAEQLIHLSELQYSRFSYEFEQISTEYLLKNARSGDCILINDISEGPHFTTLTQAGLKVIPLFHIAVAEFFCKLYLKDLFSATKVTRFFHCLEDRLGRWSVPKLLRLVFSKERDAVQSGTLLIVPSEGLKQAILQCYGNVYESKIKIVPWNLQEIPKLPESVIRQTIKDLRDVYQLQKDEKIWMTLSRISWEKGLDVLLDAIQANPPAFPFRLFICGEAAYMGGKKYLQKLKKQAEGFGNQILFPGYVHGATKEAFFQIAHLFLSTSHYEAYGLTLQEAILHHLPILSLDHHGARQHEAHIHLIPGKTRRERVQNLSQSLQNPPSSPPLHSPSPCSYPPASQQIIEFLKKLHLLES